MNEPYLAGLADAFAVCKPLGAEIPGSVERVIVEADVHHEAYRRGPCSTLTRVAMDDDHVFRITCRFEKMFVENQRKVIVESN